MLIRTWKQFAFASFSFFLACAACSDISHAGQVLVADRLTNSVYRYGVDGTFGGIFIENDANLDQPTGMAVSADQTKLYVASSQGNRVMRYDYDRVAGTATNGTLFADVADGLAFPNRIALSPDGNIVYVSNLGGTGVARFNTADGTSAGAALNGLVGGQAFVHSGLAFAPDGDLLVGGFQNFPAGDAGAVARSDDAITSLGDFIGPSAGILGVGDIIVVGNHLYVSAGITGSLSRYDATTGAIDGSFTTVTGLAFPVSMIAAPDGNGILLAELGFVDGTGNIARYNLDGSVAGPFAGVSANPLLGFTEATAMVAVVPEPSSVAMLGLGSLALLGLAVRRYRAAQR